MVDRDTEAWQRDPSFSGLQKVGGVDVSFVKGDSVRACASLVVLSYPELKVVYEDSRMVGLKAPYVSGFLAFREVPFLVELVQRLQEKEPDLMPQASGWPATLVSLQSCHASGWPRSSCRWMDWRTMLCTRRRLCSCRPEETHFL